MPKCLDKLEMVQRRAARYVQNNYHNTSSVTSMIDTLGWPTSSERRLRTAGVSCSLKEFIDGLEIIVCGKMFHCTIVVEKYPRMQQYVIFNVLKEYCISKEEEQHEECN
jgi:hypothetical protein